MSDTSEDLILPSSQELKDAEAARKTQWEKSSAKDSNGVESDQENENAEDSSKSPPKIHRTATAMAVEETVEEIEFREKYFEDNHEALTKLKLRCTACSSSLTSVVLKGRNVFHHPVLRVLMCKQCINFYGDGNFSMDEDGSDKYCRWCGQGGMLYCCSTCCCAFCKRCIKQNLNRSILKDIESEDWQCFVCNGKPLWELRAICVNAQSYSMKMRCKEEENQCNIKQLKKKRTQLKQKSRLLSQKNFSTKSSSDDDTSLNEMQELSRNRRKQNFGNSLSESEECEKKVKNGSVTENNASVSDIGASTDSEEVSSGDFKKRRNRKKKSKRELSKVGRNSSAAEKRRKTESKRGSEIADKKKLPKELDGKSAKWAYEWLEERAKELISVGEDLSHRVQRCLEKKVNLKTMTNPKNVDDVVNSLQLLIKLAGENLEHIEGFLALNYKYWVNRVIRHSSRTGTDVADSNQQGNEDGRSETITKHSQSKEDLSGVGGSDTELLSVPENERGDNGIKNGETDEDQKGAGTSKSVEMEGENSRKRKLPEETSDSSDMELVRGAEMEGDSQKSVAGDKKRKKLEDGLEMEVDVPVDTDVKSTVNDIQSECAVKMSSKPEIDMELEDILEGKTIKDASTDVTEDGGDAETEKANDMNESFLDISSQNEEVIVPEKHAECSSLHETADETSQSETNYTGSGDTVHEIDEKSEKSFESLSTVHVQQHEQDLPTREVSGIVNDPEKTAMCVEDTLQENQPKKLDEEQDCAKINVESEAKREDSEDAPVDEVSNNKENEVVSENDSNGNDASMDFLFENECDKSQGDEVEGNVNNDEIESVESLAAYLKATMKRPPEESNKTEVSDGLGKDTIAEVHCALMEGSEEDREDFEVQNHKTGSDKSDVEENKMDTSEEPGKCTKEIDEKKKLECDYEEVETSGIRKLEVNDDMSECEGKENVAGKIKAEVNEDTTEDKDNVEEKTVDSLNYTEDCIKAQQALLEYSTDDEDSCAEEPLKKIKERLKKAKENEVAVCKDTKPAKKQRSGPKSRTRKGKESTSAASASSVSDVDSSCSVRRQDIKADGGRGKKFRLKDTEAYKQGGKLGWKCTVLVERLLDEVFQKYYEQYYSDGENECEKKAKDDKEIDSAV